MPPAFEWTLAGGGGNSMDGDGNSDRLPRSKPEYTRNSSSASVSTRSSSDARVRRSRRKGSMVSSMMSIATVVMDPGAPIGDKVWFCKFSMYFAMLNALLLGLELHFTGFYVDRDERSIWMGVDIVMSFALIVETFVRFHGYGAWHWFFGAAYPDTEIGMGIFNMVDAFLALSRSFWVLYVGGVSQTPKLLSTLRLIHICNVARVCQNKNGYRELWAFIVGIGAVLPYLAWLTLIAVFFLYWFGVVMTILVDSDNNAYDYQGKTWSQDDYWGSVLQSSFTMLQVVTLDHWYSKIARPLVTQNPAFIIAFLISLLLGNVSVLNLITSFIVEATLASSVDAKDRRTKERQILDKLVMAAFKSFVERADEDHSGYIDHSELDNLTKTYIVRECLRLLGISPDDLELLFSLLDENGDGQIAISKFFRAVLRLRGDATASDLYKLHLDLTRGVTRTTSLLKGLDSTNDVLARLIDVASCMDFEVVKGEKDVHDEVLFWKRQRAALDPAQQDADERHHHLLVRFGVEEEDVSVDDALLALTDKPHKQYGAHAKKLMHASLRDGVTHAPDSTDRLASAPSRRPSMSTRSTKGSPARTKSLIKQDTTHTGFARVGHPTLGHGKSLMTHGISVGPRSGLGFFKTND
mmetsp:Transcript_29265/g.67371  ORF Transcript_29265/g.67371 Transcript_29265/m.67371 type:complete len:637 (-) Transcript_29265:127-2037(-)